MLNQPFFSELNLVAERDIDHLSGGELQRFAIGLVCVQQADVYEEPFPPRFVLSFTLSGEQ